MWESGNVSVDCDPDGTEYLIYKKERQTKTRTGMNPRDVIKVKSHAYEMLEIPSRHPF